MDIKSVTEKIQETVTAPTGAPGGVGVVISMPGTEKVVLDTSLIQLMEYESSEIPSRKRFALVEKGVTARSRRTFVTSRGDRAHIITREVFVLLTTIMQSAYNKIKQVQQENSALVTKLEAYELLINGLKRNGIID